MAYQRSRNPDAGFATDFLDVVERLGPTLWRQPDLRIVTNAGGMNPAACARRAADILRTAGLDETVVGTVAGDDLLDRLPQLVAEGHALANLDTGRPLSDVLDRVVSANAYLGAPPIAEALRRGARVVITGRVFDAALAVGPAAHEFQWNWEQWDHLAGATVAGHLIECGAQATGGLWTRWQEVPDLAGAGYPIAEIAADGTCHITKPDESGGIVNRETVVEQLLYEIGDPAHYLTPDVDADFTTVEVQEAGPNRVAVRGATGRPAPDGYKVSIAYRDGYMASGTVVLFGRDAVAKAEACGQIVLDRLRRAGVQLEQTNVECIGTGACVPGVPVEDKGRTPATPIETVLRIAVRDPRREPVERFTKELAPLVTAGTPGAAGYAEGRPKVRPVLSFWPAIIDKQAVEPRVAVHPVQELTAAT